MQRHKDKQTNNLVYIYPFFSQKLFEVVRTKIQLKSFSSLLLKGDKKRAGTQYFEQEYNNYLLIYYKNCIYLVYLTAPSPAVTQLPLLTGKFAKSLAKGQGIYQVIDQIIQGMHLLLVKCAK